MARIDLLTAYRWPFRRQMIIFVITVFITVFLGYLLDISSMLANFRKAVGREGEMKAELIATMAKVSAGEIEIAQMPLLEKHLAEWKNRLTPGAALSALLDGILRAGINNALYFGLFDPGNRTETAGQDFIPLNIVALGSYHAISAFLSRIAGFDSLVQIAQVSLSTEGRPEVVGQKLNDQATQKKLLTATIFMKIGMVPEKKPNG